MQLHSDDPDDEQRPEDRAHVDTAHLGHAALVRLHLHRGGVCKYRETETNCASSELRQGQNTLNRPAPCLFLVSELRLKAFSQGGVSGVRGSLSCIGCLQGSSNCDPYQKPGGKETVVSTICF